MIDAGRRQPPSGPSVVEVEAPEARAMYARLGYAEVPAIDDGPDADHWFAASLA